jgi:tetratricopeptide (TPR) repeat protein
MTRKRNWRFYLHSFLAAAYRRLGRYKAARAEYEEAVRIAPEDVEAHYWLGRTCILVGDLTSAIEECCALDELASEKAEALASAVQEYTHPHVTFRAGPGDTIETAVIINGAPTSSIGVNAEYQYLAKLFGARGIDWETKGQGLVRKGDRAYDKMEVVLSDGSERVVFFDITSFWLIDVQALTGGKPIVRD